MTQPDGGSELPRREMRSRRMREHRRRRIRRRGRRAYIRSVYSLPSLATLLNAVCGFAAIYLAAMVAGAAALETVTPPLAPVMMSRDPWARPLTQHGFLVPVYLIFLAMAFDALDGRLARFARHTTDFGGQLDSLADVVSFGVAPAFIALQVLRAEAPPLPLIVSRLIWAVGALYMSCAALRLARFNVSNEHGEQHHFSFLGLPSPGAAGAVIALILMQQDLRSHDHVTSLAWLASACLWLLPAVVLASGLLMVSSIRYPHLMNRYLRGRKSIARLVVILIILLLLVSAPQYTIGIGCLAYAAWGPSAWAYARAIRKSPAAAN